MLDLDDVYVFIPAMKRTALHVIEDQDTGGIDSRKLQLGEILPNHTLKYRYQRGASGGRACDIVTAGAAPLVSDRVISVLHDYTGWSTYPVCIFGKDGDIIPGYHGLAVTGRCGPADVHMGRQLWRDRPRTKKLKGSWRYYRYFSPETWDGSDFFWGPGGAGFMVVSRLAQALKNAEISNLNLWRLPEY